jgi:hypothetical protein
MTTNIMSRNTNFLRRATTQDEDYAFRIRNMCHPEFYLWLREFSAEQEQWILQCYACACHPGTSRYIYAFTYNSLYVLRVIARHLFNATSLRQVALLLENAMLWADDALPPPNGIPLLTRYARIQAFVEDPDLVFDLCDPRGPLSATDSTSDSEISDDESLRGLSLVQLQSGDSLDSLIEGIDGMNITIPRHFDDAQVGSPKKLDGTFVEVNALVRVNGLNP